MRRRLATVVVPALLLIAAPATAAAQAPPDERAAAQAFADAALRAQEAQRGLEDDVARLAETLRCEARALRGLPARRMADAFALVVTPLFRQLGALLQPSLGDFSVALHGVQTNDPALRAGRTAARRTRRLLAAFAALPEYDSCVVLRAWRRGGFRVTPTLRRARRALRFEDVQVEGLLERTMRATERMGELGVSKAGVQAFSNVANGSLGTESGSTEEGERTGVW